MNSFHTSRWAIVVILWLCLFSACHRSQSETWHSSDPTYVPYPVSEIVVSADNRFVALTVDENSGNKPQGSTDPVLYLLELKTGNHRRLESGIALLPIADHQFVAFDSAGTSKTSVTLIDGLNTLRTFDIGEHNGAWWNPKAKSIIFETGWPKDAEGFNTLAMVNPETGAVVHIHTQTSELIGICPATGHFYTEHRFPNDEKAGADEYDAEGKLEGTLHSPLAVYSAACRYVLPFAAIGAHGPDDWGVFEAKSQMPLIEFPWKDDGKTDLHWFQSWNPHQDNLLLMHSGNDPSKSDTIDVFDVEKKKVIKSLPGSSDSPPVVWSGDGGATVSARNQHAVFEPLVQ